MVRSAGEFVRNIKQITDLANSDRRGVVSIRTPPRRHAYPLKHSTGEW